MRSHTSLATALAAAVGLQLCAARGGSHTGLDAACSFAQFDGRVREMQAVCCPADGPTSVSTCDTKLPDTCSIACAKSFVPFYRDCVNTIDAVYDVHSSDQNKNGRAEVFFEFEDKCSSIRPQSLFDDISQLIAQKCTVDLSKAVSPGGAPPPPPGCVDNDSAVRNLIGQTCVQVKAAEMCWALGMLSSQSTPCACSCPVATGAHAPSPVPSGSQQPTTAAPSSATCTNIKNSYGHDGGMYGSCDDYQDSYYCMDGKVGPGWNAASWGSQVDSGAAHSCCACGGGTQATHRNLFGYTSKCTNFNAKLAQVGKACCGGAGCKKGTMPVNCTFACHAVLPAFMATCTTELQSAAGKTETAALHTLLTTCNDFPARPLIHAIADATCPTKSPSAMPTTSSPTAVPTATPTAPTSHPTPAVVPTRLPTGVPTDGCKPWTKSHDASTYLTGGTMSVLFTIPSDCSGCKSLSLTPSFKGDFDSGPGSHENIEWLKVNGHIFNITTVATCGEWKAAPIEVGNLRNCVYCYNQLIKVEVKIGSGVNGNQCGMGPIAAQMTLSLTAAKVVDTSKPTGTLLFQALGSSTVYANNWIGWYTSGRAVTTGSGKRAAYDTTPISALTFADARGRSVRYGLYSKYTGKSLLQIIQGCMKNDRIQRANRSIWSSGHCHIGVRTSWTGILGTDRFLRIGVGDSRSNSSSDRSDWALFMPMLGWGKHNYQSSKTWAFGSKYSTNTGFTGMVYIYSGRDTGSTIVQSGNMTAPGDCSFEHGMCNWNVSGAMAWKMAGMTPTTGTGPRSAEKPGMFFMYLETSSPYKTGDVSYITSPTLHDHVSSVKFSYYMYGAGMGKLSLEVYSEASSMDVSVNVYTISQSKGYATWAEKWSKSGQQQTGPDDAWRSSGFVALPQYLTWKVRFVGTKGSNMEGDMAIDSIIFDGHLDCQDDDASIARLYGAQGVHSCEAAKKNGVCTSTNPQFHASVVAYCAVTCKLGCGAFTSSHNTTANATTPAPSPSASPTAARCTDNDKAIAAMFGTQGIHSCVDGQTHNVCLALGALFCFQNLSRRLSCARRIILFPAAVSAPLVAILVCGAAHAPHQTGFSLRSRLPPGATTDPAFKAAVIAYCPVVRRVATELVFLLAGRSISLRLSS